MGESSRRRERVHTQTRAHHPSIHLSRHPALSHPPPPHTLARWLPDRTTQHPSHTYLAFSRRARLASHEVLRLAFVRRKSIDDLLRKNGGRRVRSIDFDRGDGAAFVLQTVRSIDFDRGNGTAVAPPDSQSTSPPRPKQSSSCTVAASSSSNRRTHRLASSFFHTRPLTGRPFGSHAAIAVTVVPAATAVIPWHVERGVGGLDAWMDGWMDGYLWPQAERPLLSSNRDRRSCCRLWLLRR